jgi:transcriptional regulator with XRE-family HTH domain
MGSRYFGRAVKKWRLIAALSQEQLAERAGVSVTMVGGVERERGHISEESFAKLCLGLESELGRPMLATVFSEGVEALWEELVATERCLRQEKGWEVSADETSDPGLEELDKAFDSALAEVKKFGLLLYRSRGRTGWGWAQTLQTAAPREVSGSGIRRVRARKTRPKERS